MSVTPDEPTKKPAAPRKPAAKAKPKAPVKKVIAEPVTPVDAPDVAEPTAEAVAVVETADTTPEAAPAEFDGVAFIEELFAEDKADAAATDEAEAEAEAEASEKSEATPPVPAPIFVWAGAAIGGSHAAAASDTPADEPAPVVDNPTFFPRVPAAALDSKKPAVISSTVILAMVIGALIGGVSGAAVTGLAGNIPQAITIHNPESVTDVAAAAAKAGRSVVTLSVTGKDNGGSGSGVIISPDGYILTNAHVLTLDGAAGRNTIKVTSSKGQRYDAKVIGIDTVTDLAVIKIVDGAGFAPIAWADSAKVNVGDTAVGIGAPIGLSGTVTSGIVSALDRGVILNDPTSKADGAEQGSIWVPAIQTDAAINHGNSGGPLLNAAGELIGVNVAIANVDGAAGHDSGSIGVGFAIEANVARRIANDIIDTGKASHGLLGATVSPASADPDAAIVGALVQSVVRGSAADKAGLEKGDVVIRFNGKTITSSADLTAQVRAAKAGSDAELIFVRDGRATSKMIELGNLADLKK